MILVDKDIKQRATEIFLEGYDEKNVKAVSYDLHIDGIINGDGLVKSYELRPNEIVFIKTIEQIKMPQDLMGRIGEKNSRMRQGLCVAGPHYFPGHQTYIFLRIHNISSVSIKLRTNDNIAQIFFEQLTDIPENPYNNQAGAAFNEEEQYRGLGKYKDEYEQRMTAVQNANHNLEKKVNGLYANILTIMGVFVSIFSLITINFSSLSEENLTKEFVISMNLSLGIVISSFVGLILLFLNKADNKWFLLLYIAVVAVLIVLLVFLF